MQKALAWVLVLIGVWMIIQPFVLDYSTNVLATWFTVIAGVVIGILSLVLAVGGEKTGGKTETM